MTLIIWEFGTIQSPWKFRYRAVIPDKIYVLYFKMKKIAEFLLQIS